MTTYEDIIEAQKCLVENWGEAGKNVIACALRERPFNASFDKFLSVCDTCDRNWGAMLLTGIKGLFPLVYQAIPNEMGSRAFVCLCNLLILCGVESPN